MDDPWGSPWATADELPTINLPAAPPPATLSSHSNSPRVSISAQASPWQNDDDAWGGWNDARSGTSSPGWGRNPGLKPAMVRERERDVSPGPWVGRKGEDGSVEALERRERKATLDANDVWRRGSRDEKRDALRPEEAERVSIPDSPARAESPDIPPPGAAVRTEHRPEPSRSSSKVQELVDMYEKRSVSPAEPALVSPPPQKLKDVGAEEDEELGEVVSSPVELQTDKVDLDPLAEPSGTRSAEVTHVANGLSDNEDPKTQPREAAPTTNSWPQDEPPEAAVAPTPKKTSTKHPDLTFPLDLSNLESLFPATPPTDVDPEPLPDTIIDDTFTTITERKTWYRISRFGSMRKHNHGNDENYVRMDWSRSAARDKSLRIVRRWMEEDSIAGRVSLGARRKGAAGGSMFNWDSKAEPVDVGELLGKKKGHERGGSKGSKGGIPPPAGATFGWHGHGGSKGSIDSRGAIASPPGATFGWSSQTTSPTGPSFPKSFDVKSSGVTGPQGRPQSLIMPPQSMARESAKLGPQPKARPASLIVPSPPNMARPSIDQVLPTNSWKGGNPQTEPAATQNGVEEDDEDDWGEMVSSPTVPSMNTSAPKDSDTKAGKSLVQTGAPPSAASFGWNDAPSPPQTPLEQVKPDVNAQPGSFEPSFGWEGSGKSPETIGAPQTKPNGADFGWDALEKPSNGVSGQGPGPQPPSSAALDWTDFEKSPGLERVVQTQPTTADFGWSGWQDSSKSPQEPIATPKSPPKATFSWDDFEEPSTDSAKPLAAGSHGGNDLFGRNGSPEISIEKGPQTSPLTTSSATHQMKAPLVVGPKSTSATMTSPLSPTSIPTPTILANSPPKQPHPPRTHTRTPSQTKKEDATVAKILNNLPDLSYMLR